MTEKTEEFLAHYGVKGMKWGVRRTPGGPAQTGVFVKKGKIRGVELSTRRQTDDTPSDDAAKAAINKTVVRTHSTDKLSNQELQSLVTRMNLEQQFDRLRPRKPSEHVTKFLRDQLISIGKDEAGKYAKGYITDAIKNK